MRDLAWGIRAGEVPSQGPDCEPQTGEVDAPERDRAEHGGRHEKGYDNGYARAAERDFDKYKIIKCAKYVIDDANDCILNV